MSTTSAVATTARPNAGAVGAMTALSSILGAVAGLGGVDGAAATIFAVTVAVATVAAAVVDARSRSLPHILVLPIAAAVLTFSIVAGVVDGDPLRAIIGIGTGIGVFAAGLLAWTIGGVGAGDVKLAAALAAHAALYGLGTALLGALLAAVAAVPHALLRRRHGIPYGPYLAAGYVLAMAATAIHA